MKIFGIAMRWPGTPEIITDVPSPPDHIDMVKGKYLIDVRTQEEWNRDHIAGAILIPHDRIGTQIAGIIPDKKAPIALFCHSGRRSGIALDVLRAMGYDHAENLGGIQDARRKMNLS
jgi:phage shock protein E